MSTAQRITPESQPVFPCWFLTRGVVKTWIHFTTDDRPFLLDNFTHWHPDQELAPAEAPSAPSPLPAQQGAALYLGASQIHGVGVFARKLFLVGESVPVWSAGHPDCQFVKRADFEAMPLARQDLFDTYAIETPDGWWAPLDFSRMALGWYLNHSKTPNLESKDEGESYHAIRDIKAGEELTIDYKWLDLHVDNSAALPAYSPASKGGEPNLCEGLKEEREYWLQALSDHRSNTGRENVAKAIAERVCRLRYDLKTSARNWENMVDILAKQRDEARDALKAAPAPATSGGEQLREAVKALRGVAISAYISKHLSFLQREYQDAKEAGKPNPWPGADERTIADLNAVEAALDTLEARSAPSSPKQTVGGEQDKDAEIARLKEIARRQYWALREGDNIVRHIRTTIFPGWTNMSDHDVTVCLEAYEKEHGIAPNYAAPSPTSPANKKQEQQRADLERFDDEGPDKNEEGDK